MTPELDTFTRAFIETLLWSEVDIDADGNMGDAFDAWATADDIDPEGLAQIIVDCASFQEANWDDIADDPEQAGHDFCLTRNRHGAGFWDGDWPRDVGRRLTEAAHAYGTLGLYCGDDEKLYIHG